MGSLAYMPTVQKELMTAGATFTRMYAHVPVCCPSRSSLISGRYMHVRRTQKRSPSSRRKSPTQQFMTGYSRLPRAPALQNNGCRGNAIATNCSSPDFQNGPEKTSYVTYLNAAGYRTSFAGKYRRA